MLGRARVTRFLEPCDFVLHCCARSGPKDSGGASVPRWCIYDQRQAVAWICHGVKPETRRTQGVPRHVDHEQRRRDIIQVTTTLLAEQGLNGLSFSAIAAALGGSTTMVTHYYRTRSELLEDFTSRTITEWDAEIEVLTSAHPNDPEAQLRALLFDWLLPLEGDTLDKERMRFNLLGASPVDEDTQRLLDAWEEGLRALFRRCLRPLVPAARVEPIADVLRVTFNGLAVSTVEHPDYWTGDRQRAVFESVLAAIDLGSGRHRRRNGSKGAVEPKAKTAARTSR